jgi:hypothetical protein
MLRSALAQQPNSTMAHISLGNALEASGRFEEAFRASVTPRRPRRD